MGINKVNDKILNWEACTLFNEIEEDVVNSVVNITNTSSFWNLEWQIFKNKKGENLICNLSNNWKRLKNLSLTNEKWEKVAELEFSYEQWFFYIDKLNSFERWNWWLLLNIFLNKLWKKWIFYKILLI